MSAITKPLGAHLTVGNDREHRSGRQRVGKHRACGFRKAALKELTLEAWAPIKTSALLVPTYFLQSLSFLVCKMSLLDVNPDWLSLYK